MGAALGLVTLSVVLADLTYRHVELRFHTAGC